MTGDALLLVWRSNVRRPSDLLVLLALAGLVDEFGWLAASVSEIADQARLSPRAVRAAISRLEADGWVFRSIGAGPNGVNFFCLPPLCGRAAA